MTRRRRVNGGLAALVTIALIAGCDATTPTTPLASGAITASPAPTSTGPGPSNSPAAAESAVAPAHWSNCGKGLQCADLRVPRDYSAPSNGYLTIALIRQPASDPKDRIGSLVVNPGGPGGSGVEFVRGAAEQGIFPTALRKRFDIVGFDPRGVNSSSAIRCIDNLDRPGQARPVARRPRPSSRRWSIRPASTPTNAPHATTRPCPTSRPTPWHSDLDLIRQAIGDKKLSYLGFSYGTLIGSLYAERFPERIRAMVLDGAIDPSLDLEQFRAGQAEGFEKALRIPRRLRGGRTLRLPRGWQAAGGLRSPDGRDRPRTRCPRRFDRIAAGRAVRWPRTRSSARCTTRRRGRPWRALDGRRARRRLAAAPDLRPVPGSQAERLVLEPAGRLYGQHVPGLPRAHGRRDVHGLGDRGCRDRATLRRVDRLQRPGLRVLAGPRRAAAREGHGPGAPPIVVVGTTGDPATPYAWAKALAGELDPASWSRARARAIRRTSQARASSGRSMSTCSG